MEIKASLIQSLKMNRKKSILEGRRRGESEAEENSSVEKEYRVITGAEDGSVYFWNYEMRDDSTNEGPPMNYQDVVEIDVKTSLVKEIKPAY